MQRVNGGRGAARLVVLFAAIALLAGMAPILVAHAPKADAVGAGNILKRWVATMSGSQTITQDQAVADAQNFDVIVAKKSTFTPYLSAMKAANPSVKVLAYLNGAYAQKNQGPTSGAYPTTYYAKDVNGNYITSQGDGNWLMDVTNPSWIQDRVQTCSSFINDSAYDGCYVDVLGNVSVSSNYVSSVPFNPTTGQNWTAPDWMTATANLGAAVKNANSTSFIVGNGLQNGHQYFTASQGPTSKLLTGLDGGNAQGWLRGASDPIDSFESQADWLNDVNLVVDAGTKGRSAMTMTKVWNVSPAPTQQQVDAVHRYALASFLLGTNGNQYFLFDDDPNDGAVATDHPYDHVNVGTATDAYSKDVSGAYVRHFTQGMAVVNSGTTPVTVSLGASMTDLDGNNMSQVTLQPNTGNVFTKVLAGTTTTTINANPPSAPQNFSATGGCSGVLLQWSPPSNNGGAPITGYNVYRGGWNSETFLASTPNTSYNDSSGPQWAFNYYRVTAVNAGGKESPATPNAGGSMSCAPSSTTTTTVPPTTTTTRPPTTTSTSTSTTSTSTTTTSTTTTRPTTTTSTSTTTTTRPTTTTSTSTTTTTRPTTTTSTSTTTTTRPPTTTSTSTTTTTRPSTTTTSTTIKGTPPSAPTNASLTSQCTGALLKWGPPTSSGSAPITAYNIYRGSWGAEVYLATVPASALSYNDTTGGAWTWNYYRVTAVNAAGESVPSADVGGYKTC